jgi:hypothetical protein
VTVRSATVTLNVVSFIFSMVMGMGCFSLKMRESVCFLGGLQHLGRGKVLVSYMT